MQFCYRTVAHGLVLGPPPAMPRGIRPLAIKSGGGGWQGVAAPHMPAAAPPPSHAPLLAVGRGLADSSGCSLQRRERSARAPTPGWMNFVGARQRPPPKPFICVAPQ